eukprot:CAMPEP_0201983174 /NCGR_PEP_ID=MMETSP0904-20121228/79436_1 /ASSEMBLY_ACC=CAM_ASM_000553 /TAXON_ID=420261 /ORGANISM="Thalassiosira antarctica, Strain CCMP982" /LENGTH=51 /DNA_ID=CAMNT_0048536221 /DNA_START=35 /DNA_END=186 /DNA_ORIENTATION=-
MASISPKLPCSGPNAPPLSGSHEMSSRFNGAMRSPTLPESMSSDLPSLPHS